ncbi:MAG: phosphohydrolase [Spirochaetes bacterium GWB1_48_6]|nr:MAG: phosphohydrolase [Spirochaetes bacterium GWB1_48_6]
MITENARLAMLVELDSKLNQIQDLDLVLEEILRGARSTCRADAGSLYLVEGNHLVIKYSQNETKEKELPSGEKLIYSIFKIPMDKKSISGYVASTGKVLNIPDAYKIRKNTPYNFNPIYDKLSDYKTTSILTIPLTAGHNQIVGVIQIINARDENNQVRPFGSEDELLITHFASNAVVSLERAKLTRTIILRMIRMAELRDPKETGPHVNRVAGYAALIYERWARRRGITDKELQKNQDTFRMAAMLHDVGKVAISDLILKKPAKFTPEEYEVMKTHTVSGAQLFSDRQSTFDEVAAEVALTHHENWDGTGYPGWIDPFTNAVIKADAQGKPLGRVGEEIPIWGRIVSVADVYDALSSKRVYKEAWGESDVLEEIRKMSGTKFDPELVEIFFEALPAIKQINERYPDE